MYSMAVVVVHYLVTVDPNMVPVVHCLAAVNLDTISVV